MGDTTGSLKGTVAREVSSICSDLYSYIMSSYLLQISSSVCAGLLRVERDVISMVCSYLSLNPVWMMWLTMGRASSFGVSMVGMVYSGFRTGGTIFGTKEGLRS